MGSPLSQYKINRIIELHEDGLTTKVIAARLKVGLSTVLKYKREVKPARARMGRDDVAMAMQLMSDERVSLSETAIKFEVSDAYLAGKIKDALFEEWRETLRSV